VASQFTNTGDRCDSNGAYAPVSHPFIERLIGTLRREYLDHCFFWNQHDLEKKLAAYRGYYNRSRTLQGLAGDTPEEKANAQRPEPANLHNYTWQSHCDGLFQLPIAA
jgi:hypothetical protein